MSAATEAESRMREVDDNESTDAAAPLDLLLSDADQQPDPQVPAGDVRGSVHRQPGPTPGQRWPGGRSAWPPSWPRSASDGPRSRRTRRTAASPRRRWAKNPLFKRTLQSYLATGAAMRGLVDDAELGWGDEQRMGFIIDNLVEASSPSNNPFLNPKVLKRMIDTGGGNLVNGGRRFVRDFATAPRVPSMVEPDAFEVGTDIAVTPGVVVFRTDMFELIQYTPQTDKVREIPLLIVPPTINKYYVIDLAEQRSLVEHLVAGGQQVFCISWRNPDARHADWGLDTYGQAIIEAMDATQKIARQDQISMLGICSGGMLSSMVLAHLAAEGDLDRVAAFSLAVTVLDQEQAGLPSALLSHKAAAASTRASAEKGYLDGRMLAEVFAWLRPNDLIWNYWVNNYLLGYPPKAFDILYWNADPVRMTAAMHRDFMDLAISNGLTRAGETKMLGTDLDLGKIDTDTYVVAGIADHLCKWESCYQTTQLFGGDTKFVLSTSGHIAAMVNPPGNPKASFQTASTNPADTKAWLEKASKVKGSWWDDYVDWLAERTGPERNKPTRMGSATYEPLCDAPGTYVHDR